MSKHSSSAASAMATDSSADSPTGSMKKQKNKDSSDEPLTDDFVCMTTPDKFKDTNINESNGKF